jgi:PAS domain S-box-containing protein
MSAETLADGAPTDGVTAATYDRLRQAAETYREALVVRLCGEVGLRPPEIARVRPADFRTVSTSKGTHHLLAVPSGDGSVEPVREAYVPPSVRSAVRRYVNERGIDETERLVDVTPRRIQMVVSEVGERAAGLFGDDALADVSSGDLCTYYARYLVHEEGVDPRVVLATGPWDGLESLCRRLDPVDVDTVISALEPTAVSGPTTGWHPPDLGRALAGTDLGVVVTDSDGRIEYANDGFAALVGYADRDVVGRDLASLYAGDDPVGPRTETGVSRVRLRHHDGSRVVAVRTTAALADDHLDGSDRYLTTFVAAGERSESDRVSGDGDAGPGSDGPVSRRVTAAIEGFGDVTAVLSSASDRDAVAAGVCERLATSDAYEFAWVGSISEAGVVATEWDGVDEATAGALAEAATDADADTDVDAPGTRAIDVGEVQVVEDATQHATLGSLATDRPDGEEDEYGVPGTLAFVPVTYGDTTHGLLALGTTDEAAFAREERRILEGVGWQVGQAMTDVKRRNLLLADQVLELGVRTTSDESFFVAASDRLGASFDLEGFVPGEEQSLLYFVTMTGATPDEVVGFAAEVDGIENARLIRDYGGRYLVEFVVDGEQPATTLTELGGQVTDFTVEDGAQRLTVEFTTETDVRSVFNGLQSSFPDSSLVSKQEIQRPVQTTDGLRRSLEDELTDNQQSILRAAYLAGYFEWPRGSTAEELADSIGVSSPTLHNHLRKAQQKLLTAFFDDEE